MLPSIGYFKTLNCPFFISGLCERPYCHFKHNKSETLLNSTTINIDVSNIYHSRTDDIIDEMNIAYVQPKDEFNKSQDHVILNKFQEKNFLEYMAKAIQNVNSNEKGQVNNCQQSRSEEQPDSDIDDRNYETKEIKNSYMHTEYYPKPNIKLYPEYKPTPINQLKNNKCKSPNKEQIKNLSVSPEMIKVTLRYLSSLSTDKFECLKEMFLSKCDTTEFIQTNFTTLKDNEVDKSIYTIFDPTVSSQDRLCNDQSINCAETGTMPLLPNDDKSKQFNSFFTKSLDYIHNRHKAPNGSKFVVPVSSNQNNFDLMSPLSPDQEDPDTGVELNRKTYGYSDIENNNRPLVLNDDLNNNTYRRTFALNGKNIELDEKTTRVIAAADISNYAQKRNETIKTSLINQNKYCNTKITAASNSSKLVKKDINKLAKDKPIASVGSKSKKEQINIDVDIFANVSAHNNTGDKSKMHKKPKHIPKSEYNDCKRLKALPNDSETKHKVSINIDAKTNGNEERTIHKKSNKGLLVDKSVAELFSDRSDGDNSMISISDDEYVPTAKPEVELDVDLSPHKFKKSVIHEKIAKLSNQVKLASFGSKLSHSKPDTKNILLQVEGHIKSDSLSKNVRHEEILNKKRVAHASNQVFNELITKRLHPQSETIPQAHPAAIMLKRFNEAGQKPVIKEVAKRPHVQLGVASTTTSIPVNVRQRYLTLIHDECIKICQLTSAITGNADEGNNGGQPNEASQMALLEERQVYDKCRHTKSIYFNLAVACIKRLRSAASVQARSLDDPASRAGGEACRQRLSQEEIFTLHLKRHYVLSLEQLKENGFPIPDPLESPPGSIDSRAGLDFDSDLPSTNKVNSQSFRIAFYDNPDRLPRPMPSRRRSTAKGTTRDKATDASALEREHVVTHRLICSRCGTEYRLRLGPGPDDYSYLDKTGPAGSECVYHWGKAWKTKATRSRTWETRYTCCRADIGAPGCTLARAHVTDDVTTTLGPASFESGWVRTRPPRPGRGTPAATRPFALDCEMVYTPWGPELARVTVVGYDGTTAYESMVRPSHSSVVDYNTRFSGITEAMLAGDDVRSLDQVQADILDLVPASAILIGHSLESDLVVLKMVHLTVVDTSVVFPHRLGAPYKRALKNLMSEHLKRIIQDDVDGHDSREDAAACMELMKWKVKHDMPKTNA